jgi:nitrogen-specific signal transduction histidine kinase
LLVIDEISDKLLPKDIEKLHYIISMLRQGGTTVLYVSRNIDEILNFANRVTILNKGRIVETTEISNIDKLQLVQLAYSSMSSRDQLEKNNLELFYLHNFNRSILHNLPLPILVTDSKGHIALMNRLFARLSGLHYADVTGKPIQEILSVQGHHLPMTKQALRNLEPYRLPHVRWPQGASPNEVTLEVIPCFDEDQAFIGTIYLLNNPGEEAGFAKYLKQTQSFQEHHKTLAEVAHEINNPLGIMLNYLQLLKTGTTLEQIQVNAGIIEKEIKRIKRILRHLTDLKEAEAPAANMVRLGDVIDEVALLLLPLMRSNQIQLAINGQRDIRVALEADLLKQVVLNIMLNGIEAMPTGGELGVQLQYAEVQKQRYASLVITDEGIGIPEEHRTKIFEPFFTTKDTTESRGLGLSLCQDIITQVHGVIEVEPRLPRGTTFRVLIPDVA